MRSDNPAFFFTLLHPEYFESIDRYHPTSSFREVVEPLLGTDWHAKVGGYWTQYVPDGYAFRAHGWKVHISTIPQNSLETLRLVVPLIASERIAFKFCSDPLMLRLSLAKNWPRTGSGKFVTIYPLDESQFCRLLEQCHELTSHLRGPYILSDRPYKDSRVVYYRYGEHERASTLNSAGQLLPEIVGPDGEVVLDQRQPYFRLPPWVSDPVANTPLEIDEPPEDGLVLHGRYRVTGSERFSSFGGIYAATDMETRADVIVREARPFLGATGDVPARLLHKEARILRKMEKTGYFARFVDFFQEWENWYLVQERLDAETLWGYAINFTHGVGTKSRNSVELFETVRTTIRKIAEALAVVHAHQVVLRDLTKTNVMITRDTNEVRFVDLELAFEMDRSDLPISGWTAGYASREQIHNEMPTPADDHYAFGALILDMLAFTAAGLSINRAGVFAGLDLVLEDLGLPGELRRIVEGLTTDDPNDRWDLGRVVETLESLEVQPRHVATSVEESVVPERPDPPPRLVRDLRETIDGVVRFTMASADYTRNDRLWPASGAVYLTNPLGVQYGAAGPLYFLCQATGRIPEKPLNWLLQRLDATSFPPGLFMGLSGVAVTLLELGLVDTANELMERSFGTNTIYNDPGIYHGAAGWGMANLRFWSGTGNKLYLQRATDVGEYLLRTAQSEAEGYTWLTNDVIHFGFAHGASGVATFLDCLYAAQGDERFLQCAEHALDYEMAHAEKVDRRVLWHSSDGARASSPKSPHMRFGTAGVGTAVLRHYVLTGDKRFLEFAEVCAYSVADRFTNKLWYDFGIAGFGEFLLDMHYFLGGKKYCNAAYFLAEHLIKHRIPRGDGFAFLGEEMLRISCDFGLGSAGIGLFLCRLLNPNVSRYLLVDDLIENGAAVRLPIRDRDPIIDLVEAAPRV